jgi:long-chain acyl-CoA synthetase
LADQVVVASRGDAPAITAGGATITYDEFQEMVDEVELTGSVSVEIAGRDLTGALCRLFAAARADVPVLVGASSSDLGGHPLPAETFLVVGTSGSSGHPRLLARTAVSWAASFRPLADLAGLTETDSVLLTGPLESTLHLFAAVHTLWLGAHLTDDPASATAAHVVPTVLADLLEDPPPSLRTVVVAGALLPAETERRALELGIRLVEYYGAAELSFVAARVAPGPLMPFPGVEVRIVDGEIWAKSPYLALDRIGSPAPFRRSPDGYLSAGDLGLIDQQGALVVRGRGNTAVTTGGHTVLVEDVESVLRSIAGVRDAAVFAVANSRLGEVVAAAVVLESEHPLDAVRAAARQLLSGPSLPRRWFTPDALPRTPGGKIARAELARSVR